jgi:hypothetical protein
VFQPNLSELEKLRILYKEILEGFSYFEGLDIYVKHLTDLDNTRITEKKHKLYLNYKKDLPSEQEKLQQLYDTEQWSKDKEEQILNHRYVVTDNEKNLKNIIPQQHGPILKVIEANRIELQNLLRERRQLIGRTAEEFAERDTFYYMIYLSMFKDKELKNPRFLSFQDLENMEDDEIQPYVELLDKTFSQFTEENLKKISTLPLFINTFSYAKDNVSTFLGKPIIQITPYQLSLFSLGVRNINILTQSDGEPPVLLDDIKVEDVVNWYDQQYSIILGKRNTVK